MLLNLTRTRKSMTARTKIGRRMPETIHLYQIDGGYYYWEAYSDYTNDYLFSLDNDEVGDYIAENKHIDIRVYPQESYQAIYHVHLEMDKWWGRDDYHLDDCEAIHNPRLPFDYLCEGCAAYEKWAKNKTYGDYNKIGLK